MKLTIDNFLFAGMQDGFLKIAYIGPGAKGDSIITNSPKVFAAILEVDEPTQADLNRLKDLCQHKIAIWPDKKSGGARKGSGRPVTRPATRTISVKVPADQYDALKVKINALVKRKK